MANAYDTSEKAALERFAKLMFARDQPGADQAKLGPIEHGAFVEAMVTEHPAMAVPMFFATPAYTAGKAAGLLKTRSPPSVSEMAEGYYGIGRGLSNAATNAYHDIMGTSAVQAMVAALAPSNTGTPVESSNLRGTSPLEDVMRVLQTAVNGPAKPQDNGLKIASE